MWTPVPVRDKWVFCRTILDSNKEKKKHKFRVVWFRDGKETPFYNKATQFLTPDTKEL